MHVYMSLREHALAAAPWCTRGSDYSTFAHMPTEEIKLSQWQPTLTAVWWTHCPVTQRKVMHVAKFQCDLGQITCTWATHRSDVQCVRPEHSAWSPQLIAWDTVKSSWAVRKSRWPSWVPRHNEPYGFCGRKATLNRANALVMMSWCLMSSDVIWHIRDKLWPMPKHGSIKATYVRCMRV